MTKNSSSSLHLFLYTFSYLVRTDSPSVTKGVTHTVVSREAMLNGCVRKEGQQTNVGMEEQERSFIKKSPLCHWAGVRASF